MESRSTPDLPLSDLTGRVIGTFYDVYNELVGLPEFVLVRAMAVALRQEGLTTESEVTLPVWFRGQRIASFRVDLLVDSRLILEVKTRSAIHPFDQTQLLHYLKVTKIDVGLLLNFGIKPEFKRLVYDQTRKRPPFVPPADAAKPKSTEAHTASTTAKESPE